MTRDLALRVFFQNANPATEPVDVLVLDFHHLAAPASGVERADDAVAHFVARRESRLRIPHVAAHDLTAERLRDLERGGDLLL
jgi:hypothetical protein